MTPSGTAKTGSPPSISVPRRLRRHHPAKHEDGLRGVLLRALGHHPILSHRRQRLGHADQCREETLCAPMGLIWVSSQSSATGEAIKGCDGGGPDEANCGRERISSPQSCRTVARHSSGKVRRSAQFPKLWNGCPRVAGQLLREPVIGPNSTNIGGCCPLFCR